MEDYVYDSDYARFLVKHMKAGYSFDTFSAQIGIPEEVIKKWLKEYPDFDRAKKLGNAHHRLFWERMGIAGAAGQLKNFNAKTWSIIMTNFHNYSDRQEVEHTVSGIQVNLYLPENGRDAPRIETSES